MAGIRRVLGWAAAAAVGLPLLAAGAAWGWLRWQVPAPGGDAALPGLEQPVTVIRDADGIPHIRAASPRDAYAALGYLHAQDRLWQMEMARRAGAGRLSEALGGQPFLLRTDRLMRTLGLYRRAEASLSALSPGTRAALDAYAAGVNAYLAHRREALPLEFQLLRLTPEPWRPADSVVWAKVMALRLSTNYRSEIHRARLLARLPPGRVEALFPPPRPGAPTTLAALDGAPDGALEGIGPDRLAALAAALPPEPPGLGLASNEWVLDGRLTATGKPILANDPHLELEAPILWYLARIDAPGLSLAGATAPGMPFHLLGHNGRLAWGFTMTYSDTQDLFVERVDPADPSRYLTPGGSAPFVTRTETIAVSGAPSETITVRETRHGPVLSDLEGGDLAGAGDVLALAFTGLGAADTSVEALHRLNRAGTGAEVRAALALHQSPQQNVAYATTDDTIGLIAPGWVPVRRRGDGRLPVPGWTGDYDWTGMIPFDELPQVENPPSGRLVNANNAVVGPDYPHLIAAEWPEPLRARRIAAMLDGGGPFTLDGVTAQQMDAVSTAAGDLLPLMLAVTPASPRAERAVALLTGWDRRMDRTRPEPLIFAAWQRELSRTLFAQDLGPLFTEGLWESARLVQDALTAGSGGGCGPADDACAAVLSASLERALDGLAAGYGGDPAGWRWGDAHRAVLSHRLLSLIPGIGRLFDLSLPADGGNDTVNRGSHTLSNPGAPFAQVHGAGLRAVYDLADLDRSRFIIATGQSGNPLSPYWGNLVHRWRDGGFVEMPPEPTPAARLTLHPIPAGPSP
ncbi:penicillin amidase [Azospirillum fermentarium]|uniref:penicillin acylase family protein n=1 Tax=Azospirillum fermentarium TaxID=1233114 RepID=UPI00222757E1|nr:penicillin acylase family protein [Azospirillum fermentarium]MCW2247051.1 penicillin amidase [Azospirillum fermentarium]